MKKWCLEHLPCKCHEGELYAVLTTKMLMIAYGHTMEPFVLTYQANVVLEQSADLVKALKEVEIMVPLPINNKQFMWSVFYWPHKLHTS